ncbi:MAG: hypothetical protein GF398_21995 [Chitinivibrionales bacterium]|nr:hypothetical protein [Chitinivibrionales bacterium]
MNTGLSHIPHLIHRREGRALASGLLILVWLPCLLVAWPWVNQQGKAGVEVRANGILINEKFAHGQSALGEKGERVPFFEDRRDNVLKKIETRFAIDFIPLDKLQIKLETAFVSAHAGGFESVNDPGDSHISLKYQLPIPVVVATYAGLTLPTGKKSQSALALSTGEGYWVTWLGLASGYATHHLFLFTSQQFNFPSRRPLPNNNRFAQFENDHVRKGPAWQGAITGLLGYDYWGAGLSAEWLVSGDLSGSFLGTTIRGWPGDAHFSVRGFADQKLGSIKLREAFVVPLAGINWPAAPSIELGVIYSFSFSSEGS